jgi:hypothetical protein
VTAGGDPLFMNVNYEEEDLMPAKPESPRSRKNMQGVRVGRLVVQDMAYINQTKNVVWNCLCDCGKQHQATSNVLSMQKVKSCGCLRRDTTRANSTKHGLTGTDEQTIHTLMLERCRNPNATNYASYGGRGITVCDRWKGESGLLNFIADMGLRPSKKHSIDRIDNDKGYSPKNCRWATDSDQVRNRRMLASNKSGVTGVSWVERDKAWVAAARVNNKIHRLLWTKDFFEAACARKSFDLRHPVGA